MNKREDIGISKYMLSKYIEDVYLTTTTLQDDKDREESLYLLDLLKNLTYNISALCDEFPIDEDTENIPDMVYIFCLDKMKFWKPCNRGYTESLYDAGLYSLQEAKLKVEMPSSNLKIVYFDVFKD